MGWHPYGFAQPTVKWSHLLTNIWWGEGGLGGWDGTVFLYFNNLLNIYTWNLTTNTQKRSPCLQVCLPLAAFLDAAYQLVCLPVCCLPDCMPACSLPACFLPACSLPSCSLPACTLPTCMLSPCLFSACLYSACLYYACLTSSCLYFFLPVRPMTCTSSCLYVYACKSSCLYV